jgi:acyl carrier protein
MQNAEQTLDEILTLAAAHFKVPCEKLSPDEDFFKTLGIDSLQTLDLLTKLENHFHVELPDYELQGVSDFRIGATVAHNAPFQESKVSDLQSTVVR